MNQNLIQQIQQAQAVTKEAKKKYYLSHFYEFNRDVLGWPDIYEPLHREVCEFVQNNVKNKKLLILLPRGSFKSSMITIGFPLWRLASNPQERVLIGNATYPMATSFLSQIKDHISKNEVFKGLFGDFSANAASWREDRITLSREKAYEQKEPSVIAQGMSTNVTGSHYSLGILDDMVNRENITTRDQMDKVINFFKDALDLIDVNENDHKEIICIGCFVAGTKVLMENGLWKNIEDIETGEIVKTRKGNKEVMGMIPQEEANIYELRTGNSVIRGTGDHPFWSLDRDKWISLKELKRNEKIAFYRLKHGGKNEISKDLAWSLGYMVGDGWVTLHPNKKGSMRYVVGIAEGVYEDRNKRIVDVFEKEFGCKFKNRNRNFTVTCAELGRWLLESGLERGAHNKDVPDWIFTQSLSVRIAFIKGFLDADGWKEKGKTIVKGENKGRFLQYYCYEVTSKKLADGIRRLAIISGLGVNNIYSRTRLIQAPNSKAPILSTTYHCRLAFGLKRSKIVSSRVASIKKIGRDKVYDLSVKGEHSFIANGFIVHNTTWHHADLYSWIQDEETGIIGDFEVMRKPAYTGEWKKGKLLFPPRLGWKVLEGLKRSQGTSHFSSQYLLEPKSIEDAIFKFKFKSYEESDIRGLELNKFVTIDPAISEKKEADYSAMVCVGVDKNNNWYILDLWRDKVPPKRLLDQMFYWDDKWKPNKVGIETTAFQKALQFFAYDEMKRKNHFIPIMELKHSDTSKYDRIMGLEPRYETGSVFHPQKTSVPLVEELEEELRDFDKGKHDDLIDALASQLELTFPAKQKSERKSNRKRSGYPA